MDNIHLIQAGPNSESLGPDIPRQVYTRVTHLSAKINKYKDQTSQATKMWQK